MDEAYRILRTNLLVAASSLDRPTVLFTSARAGEGKTATVAYLGRVMALAGQHVVLVDLDLRRPDLHRAFGLTNDKGASDVLRGRVGLDDALQYVAFSHSLDQPDQAERGVYVLTGGTVAENPSELLGSVRTTQLLDVLGDQADIVLIDSAPVLPTADTLILSSLVGGAVLVVEARRTPMPVVLQAKDALTGNQARLLGVVVSKLHPREASGFEDTEPPV